MKRLLGGALLGIGLTGIVLAIVHAAAPGRGALELDVFILVAGAFALLSAVLATRQAFPAAEGSALAEALEPEEREPERPPELERTERLLTLASTTAFDLHFRLRPILREVTEQRLADRRGLRLDAGGPQVEQALGEELWEIVRRTASLRTAASSRERRLRPSSARSSAWSRSRDDHGAGRTV